MGLLLPPSELIVEAVEAARLLPLASFLASDVCDDSSKETSVIHSEHEHRIDENLFTYVRVGMCCQDYPIF